MPDKHYSHENNIKRHSHCFMWLSSFLFNEKFTYKVQYIPNIKQLLAVVCICQCTLYRLFVHQFTRKLQKLIFLRENVKFVNFTGFVSKCWGHGSTTSANPRALVCNIGPSHTDYSTVQRDPHCLKIYFFRLAVSKCSVIYHWHVCDRSQMKMSP